MSKEEEQDALTILDHKLAFLTSQIHLLSAPLSLPATYTPKPNHESGPLYVSFPSCAGGPSFASLPFLLNPFLLNLLCLAEADTYPVPQTSKEHRFRPPQTERDPAPPHAAPLLRDLQTTRRRADRPAVLERCRSGAVQQLRRREGEERGARTRDGLRHPKQHRRTPIPLARRRR
jgi:hypothetical protein